MTLVGMLESPGTKLKATAEERFELACQDLFWRAVDAWVPPPTQGQDLDPEDTPEDTGLKLAAFFTTVSSQLI